MFVLKLPRFFTRLYSGEKRAAISKLTYIWTPSSRSYIVFTLVRCFSYAFSVDNLAYMNMPKPSFSINEGVFMLSISRRARAQSSSHALLSTRGWPAGEVLTTNR